VILAWLVCRIRGHRGAVWWIRPALVAVPVEWLRWERECDRCHRVERRWFRVPPARPHLAMGGTQYVAWRRPDAPLPDELRASRAGEERPA
jgi:hypothetical protein